MLTPNSRSSSERSESLSSVIDLCRPLVGEDEPLLGETSAPLVPRLRSLEMDWGRRRGRRGKEGEEGVEERRGERGGGKRTDEQRGEEQRREKEIQ